MSLYKLVDSKNNPDNYKTLIRIGAIIEDSEMLRFVPDHLKTKTCKNAFKKLPFVMKYVTDWYKTKEICDKGIMHDSGMVGFIPNCYKDQEMRNKSIDNYTWFGLDCYMTQKIFRNVQ